MIFDLFRPAARKGIGGDAEIEHWNYIKRILKLYLSTA